MFNVDMFYAFIFNMPVKLRLKLMASISSYGMDSEWKLIDHIINKFNGILLSALIRVASSMAVY